MNQSEQAYVLLLQRMLRMIENHGLPVSETNKRVIQGLYAHLYRRYGRHMHLYPALTQAVKEAFDLPAEPISN